MSQRTLSSPQKYIVKFVSLKRLGTCFAHNTGMHYNTTGSRASERETMPLRLKCLPRVEELKDGAHGSHAVPCSKVSVNEAGGGQVLHATADVLAHSGDCMKIQAL